MKLAVVIGMGEVGRPIWDMLSVAYGVDEVGMFDVHETLKAQTVPGALFTFMHICFPQTETFVHDVCSYIEKYRPYAVIVHSTLSPGMTERLKFLCDFDDSSIFKPHFIYSPVRGNIRDGMHWCLRAYTKYLAPATMFDETAELVEHLEGAGFKVKVCKNAIILEYAKILDLAWYGLNIAFYQEFERLINVDLFGLNAYKNIREFIESTPIESEGKAPRVVFYGGHIGGHCVIQGIEKLLAKHDIPMLQAVLESNIKRERELTFSPAACLGRLFDAASEEDEGHSSQTTSEDPG